VFVVIDRFSTKKADISSGHFTAQQYPTFLDMSLYPLSEYQQISRDFKQTVSSRRAFSAAVIRGTPAAS
jgi:hypothetical protein